MTQRHERGDVPSLAPPRSRDRLDEASLVGWLVCPPLEPFPVGPTPTLTIGRDVACDLVLPHVSVSRVHAVVHVAGGRITIEDRSTDGLKDADAVLSMIARRKDYFAFRPGVEAGERTMTTTIMEILLEASRRQDEDA